MTQVVEAEVGDAGLLASGLERSAELLDGLGRTHVTLEATLEHEAVRARDDALEQVPQLIRHGQNEQLAARKAALDAKLDFAVVEVYLLPAEFEDVREAHASQESEPDRSLQMNGGARDQSLRFLGRKPARPRFGLDEHVLLDPDNRPFIPPFLRRLVDDLAERGQDAVHGAVADLSTQLRFQGSDPGIIDLVQEGVFAEVGEDVATVVANRSVAGLEVPGILKPVATEQCVD